VKNHCVGKDIYNSKKLKEELVSLKCLKSHLAILKRKKISQKFTKIHQDMKVKTLNLAIVEKKI
jgi:hypothetical protein